eukprot:TRINITY_DN10487_c0_g1_i1.p2 TRINITY_DN10487_c0_g1~~TRINITY_DN10487_c0_g1_i1.p2  ORF type:complete len:101 (+),score=14.69 TRINITY_DN10487_c0_g1_i1:248-550(+)
MAARLKYGEQSVINMRCAQKGRGGTDERMCKTSPWHELISLQRQANALQRHAGRFSLMQNMNLLAQCFSQTWLTCFKGSCASTNLSPENGQATLAHKGVA